MRGEARDERMAQGGGWGRDKDQVMDVRTVLPRDLLNGPYVTQISSVSPLHSVHLVVLMTSLENRYNPIAPTLMKKALQSMVRRHFSSRPSSMAPSKATLDVIVESSNGDIRSAINTLEFACTISLNAKKRGSSSVVVLESVTRREQSLALFHLLGKVLFNKRKGDAPSSSLSAKDALKEKELDRLLPDPPILPPHLNEHERRTSRVDVDAIYADSPIDSSLFGLYLHQNYTGFCEELDEVEGVVDWLSWVDSSGGEAVSIRSITSLCSLRSYQLCLTVVPNEPAPISPPGTRHTALASQSGHSPRSKDIQARVL